jgi:hypothetical protein
VIFESGSQLQRIHGFAFCRSGLKAIAIPSSVAVLGKACFSDCKSLESLAFERECRLELIDEDSFRGTGLKSAEIPSSVVVLGKSSFHGCASLE